MNSTTVLKYEVTTDPFPLQASPQGGAAVIAAMTVVATNQTGNPVTLQGIIVAFPVGNDADELTSNTDSIGPVPPDGWNPPTLNTSNGLIQYIFHPQEGRGALPPNDSIVFTFNGLQVNYTPGSFPLTVTEGSNNCVPPDCPSAVFQLSKFPYEWGNVDFWLDSPDLPYGGAETLHWDGPEGATYTISYYTVEKGIVQIPAAGDPPLANRGQYPASTDPQLTLDQTTVFTLDVDDTIAGQDYHAQVQATATVSVPAPVILEFTGAMKTVGDQTVLVLNWATQYAASCSLTGDPSQLTPSSPAGGYQISLSANQLPLSAYTLTAVNTSGSAVSTIQITWSMTQTLALPTAGPTALSLDNRTLYATTTRGHTVVAVDTATMTQIGQGCAIGTTSPTEPVVMPNGDVAVICQNNPPELASVALLTATGNPASPLSLVGSPVMIGNIEGNIAATANSVLATSLMGVQTPFSAYLTILAPDSQSGFSASQRIELVTNASEGCWVAASPDGKRAYVTLPNQIQTYDLTANPVVPLGAPLALGSQPGDILVSPDGGTLYVACSAGEILVIEANSDPANPLQDTGVVIPISDPQIMALNPGGSALFVIAWSGTRSLSIVDLLSTPPQVIGSPTALPLGAYFLVVPPGPARAILSVMSENADAGLYTLAPAVSGGTAPAALSSGSSAYA